MGKKNKKAELLEETSTEVTDNSNMLLFEVVLHYLEPIYQVLMIEGPSAEAVSDKIYSDLAASKADYRNFRIVHMNVVDTKATNRIN